MTDRVLGVLIAKLEELGLYDDAILVVAADHGQGFVPGFPKRLIREATVGHLGPVPFFFKRPGQREGVISDVPLQTVDVVPTIADELDLSRLWPDVDGVSAFSDVDPDRERKIQSVEIDPRGIELREAVAAKYATFGQTEGSLDIFGLAPPGGEGLPGRYVDEFEIGEATGVTIGLDVQNYADATPDAERVPALMNGDVRGTLMGLLVVAINGRIAAVTRPYGEGRFQAMIPPWAFDRPNEIGVYTYDGGQLDLVPWSRRN